MLKSVKKHLCQPEIEDKNVPWEKDHDSLCVVCEWNEKHETEREFE